MPFTSSTEVAKAWEVDHNALCGKLLGHRRRKWMDANPPCSSTSGAWDPRSTHRWGWPPCRCGPTRPSPTTESWRTEAPSQACGTPWTGCRASQRASSRGRRCPPSWTDILTVGPPGTTAPWAPPSPRDRRRRPPASGAQPVALARVMSRSSCHLAPGRAEPCAGRRSLAWRGSGRTRLTPMGVFSGRQRRGPQAPGGDLSDLPPDGILISSTNSRITAHCKSRGSLTSIGPRWSIPSRRRSSPRKEKRGPCSLGLVPLSPLGTARLGIPHPPVWKAA